MEYLVITIFILASLVVLALRVITGVRSKVLPSVNQAQKSPVNQSGPALRRQPKIKQLALGQLAVVLFLGAIFVGGLGLNVAEVAWAAPAPPAKLSVNSMPAAIPARQESAQITGVVYLDYNADGERSDREPGEAGIIVTAYNVTGTVVASDTTVAPSGAYTLTTIPAGTAVRIEVTGLPADIQPGPIGPDSSTTVAFVTVGGAGSVEVLDLAVVRPSQYCEDNPLLVTSCYVVGDQDSDDPVIVDFPYNAGAVPGTTTDPTDFDIPSTHGITVSARIVGTTYGIAYQRTPDARRMFAGAFMHRHSGFGPGGTGAIYVTDVTSDTAGTTSILTTLSAGPDLHGTEFFTDYLELPSGNPITNTWDATGKTALGDLDISEDGETLFAVNLFDLGLYQIPTDGAGPIISDTVPVDLPGIAPGAGNACNSEDVRPFGLGVRDGLVYVGMVCTAESSQDPADLHAYIYTFDPTSRTFALTPALDFALDDNRGCTFQRSSPATCLSAIWRPWVPVFTADTAPSGDFPGELLSSYPQPMLADIEFDDDGSMILGFRDRYGDQVGYRSPSSPFTDTLYISIVGGDVLYACQDGAGGWLEPGSGGCANNYDDNYFLTHDETSMGGMVRVPGRPETVMTSFDPIPLDNQILDGGLRWYNNETGDIAQAYRLYSSNDEPVIRTFGKGNGLGDVEALCSLAPIEVGNRIWLDEDGDGIQDPGELPIGGVEVQLYRDGNLLGSATTDDDGTYYFIDVTNPISPSRESQSNYGVVNGLGPNLVYEIRVALTQTAIASYTLTASNTTDDDTNDNKTDLIDSDAVQVGSTAVISFSTGGPGANNHTLDIGLLEGELVSLGDTVWLDVNNDGV
ncbi:MAG TPA: SdrD B-like domain-containing protein, partial [Anaerolineae bacterium]|nr:SdrD B-like domain-containing protein [Anaerolineae bacterium]